jgi:hypothetical protein
VAKLKTNWLWPNIYILELMEYTPHHRMRRIQTCQSLRLLHAKGKKRFSLFRRPGRWMPEYYYKHFFCARLLQALLPRNQQMRRASPLMLSRSSGPHVHMQLLICQAVQQCGLLATGSPGMTVKIESNCCHGQSSDRRKQTTRWRRWPGENKERTLCCSGAQIHTDTGRTVGPVRAIVVLVLPECSHRHRLPEVPASSGENQHSTLLSQTNRGRRQNRVRPSGQIACAGADSSGHENGKYCTETKEKDDAAVAVGTLCCMCRGCKSCLAVPRTQSHRKGHELYQEGM